MYDANMSEQKEVLLGNYIIQQVLSSPSLNDELFVQVSSMPKFTMEIAVLGIKVVLGMLFASEMLIRNFNNKVSTQ